MDVMRCKTFLYNRWVKVFAEVDDSVLEGSSASWGVAYSAGQMLLGRFHCSDPVVSHMFSATFGAQLQVVVSMKFNEIVGMDSALAMKPIDILTHNALEVAPPLEFDHGHMSL